MFYSKSKYLLTVFVLIYLLSAIDTAAPKRPEMFDFFSSGVTTGYETNNLLLCTPEFNARHRPLSREYISGEIKKQEPNHQYHLIPVPDSFATRYIKDIPGDTVMVLWSGGKFKAVIDDIVYYISGGGCYSEFVCVLEPITEITNRPKRFKDFIALRKEKFYDGPIIPYIEYQLDDSSYLAIVDSLTREMTRTRLVEDSISFEMGLTHTPEDRKEQYIANHEKRTTEVYYPFRDIRYYLYGIESEEVPDTLYLMVIGDMLGESSWVAQLELSRVRGKWKTRTISEPHRGSYRNIIRFAFDLNGDEVMEYFINNSIYILFNGVFAIAKGGPYRGC